MTEHINPNSVHAAIGFNPEVEAFFLSLMGVLSPLDQPIAVTTFPDQKGRTKKERALSLREIGRMVQAAKRATKDECPFLKLASFGPDRTPRGCLRNNANMLSISGVEGDYDGGPITLPEARDRLEEAGIAAIVYDSPSALPGVNKWRVLAALSVEALPAERRTYVAKLHRLFDGALDPASFTASQSFYFGGVAGRTPRVLEADGDYLDRTGIEPLLPEGDKGDRKTGGEKTGLPAEDFAAAVRAVKNDSRFNARADWLRMGAAIWHETDGSEDGRALFDAFSQGHGSYDPDDTEAAWESFDPPRSTGATVLHFALTDGWKPPIRDLDDAFEEEPVEETPPAQADARPIIFLTPDQCAASPARDYVVKGLIAPGDVGCIFGEPGAGKSLISPLIGYRVAQGERAFNLRTRMGGVFYVAAEDPTGMKGRIRALRQKYGDAPDFRLVPGIGGLFDFVAGKPSPAFSTLRKEVAKQRPALIVIDTLAMAFPDLDENDAKSMAVVVAAGRKLAEHGAAVLFVHHTPKGGDTPRGHSVFNGALDVSLLVEKGEAKGIVRGRLPKNRNGSPDHDIAFRIGVADFGADDDGDRITAAYALELEGGDGRRRERLTKAEDAALTALVHLLAETEWVSESAWREAMMRDARVSASDKPDNRRRNVVRCIEGLTRKGAVEQEGTQFRAAKSGRDFSDAFQDGGDDASD